MQAHSTGCWQYVKVTTRGVMFWYYSRTASLTSRHTTTLQCHHAHSNLPSIFKSDFLLKSFHAVLFLQNVTDSQVGPRWWCINCDQCDTCMIRSRRLRHTLVVKRASDFSRLFHETNLMKTKQSKHTAQVDFVQITSFNSSFQQFSESHTLKRAYEMRKSYLIKICGTDFRT